MHALLNPKPAGPFCQVGDKQMLALQRLAAIFESAQPARKKDTTSPLCEINASDALPRVQTKISRQRVIIVQRLSGKFSQLLLPARPQIRIGDQVQHRPEQLHPIHHMQG
jgi:hypothetical protein